MALELELYWTRTPAAGAIWDPVVFSNKVVIGSGTHVLAFDFDNTPLWDYSAGSTVFAPGDTTQDTVEIDYIYFVRSGTYVVCINTNGALVNQTGAHDSRWRVVNANNGYILINLVQYTGYLYSAPLTYVCSRFRPGSWPAFGWYLGLVNFYGSWWYNNTCNLYAYNHSCGLAWQAGNACARQIAAYGDSFYGAKDAWMEKRRESDGHQYWSSSAFASHGRANVSADGIWMHNYSHIKKATLAGSLVWSSAQTFRKSLQRGTPFVYLTRTYFIDWAEGANNSFLVVLNEDGTTREEHDLGFHVERNVKGREGYFFFTNGTSLFCYREVEVAPEGYGSHIVKRWGRVGFQMKTM